MHVSLYNSPSDPPTPGSKWRDGIPEDFVSLFRNNDECTLCIEDLPIGMSICGNCGAKSCYRYLGRFALSGSREVLKENLRQHEGMYGANCPPCRSLRCHDTSIWGVDKIPLPGNSWSVNDRALWDRMGTVSEMAGAEYIEWSKSN